MSRATRVSLAVCILALGVRVTVLDTAWDGLALLAWSAGLVALVGWIRGGAE